MQQWWEVEQDAEAHKPDVEGRENQLDLGARSAHGTEQSLSHGQLRISHANLQCWRVSSWRRRLLLARCKDDCVKIMLTATKYVRGGDAVGVLGGLSALKMTLKELVNRMPTS